MATLKIGLADLEQELRRLPARDREALTRAIRRTLQVDAHRWLQWSIRGGGMGGAPPRTVKKPAKARVPREQESQISRLWKRLVSIFGPAQKARMPRQSKLKPKDPCARGEPPKGYRQPIDTGDYARSWKYEDTEDGGQLYSASSPPIKAGVIELGRRPAPIPIRPLAEWVRRKLGCKDPKKSVGIAIAISKTAEKQRREGLFVLKRAHPKIAEALAKNVAREIRAGRPGT